MVGKEQDNNPEVVVEMSVYYQFNIFVTFKTVFTSKSQINTANQGIENDIKRKSVVLNWTEVTVTPADNRAFTVCT